MTIAYIPRLSKHGQGEYALPGGHLELGESFEQCATRELLEETGIQVSTDWSFVHAVNCVFSPTKHYVTIFMLSDVPQVCGLILSISASYTIVQDTVARNMEPEKCAGWDWVAWSDVPPPVFLPLHLLISMKHAVTTL